MPIVWVPFDPETGKIKADADNKDTGYVIGYVSELGKESDFPDATIVNDVVMPTFIPKFETEIVRNLDYEAVTTTTFSSDYAWYDPDDYPRPNPGEYGFQSWGSISSSSTDVKTDINVDNRDKVLKEINSWLVDKYETILSKIGGFFIITERELVHSPNSSVTNKSSGFTAMKSGSTGNQTTTSTQSTKNKEILKGLRKLPTQIIKCKIRQ